MDYQAVQKSGDVADPRAVASYIKSGFLTSIPEGLVDAIVDGIQAHPGRMTGIFAQPAGGAISRVSSSATALSQRDAQANMLAVVGWPHGGPDPAEHIAWIRQFWTKLEPFTYGFYVNDFEGDMSAAQVQANYRQNHDRLVRVKNRYDPRNLFRLNANIPPTMGAVGR
jgi:hypothetical protein